MSASASTFVLIPSFCTLQGRIQNVFGLKMDGFLDDFVAQAVHSSAMLGVFNAIRPPTGNKHMNRFEFK